MSGHARMDGEGHRLKDFPMTLTFYSSLRRDRLWAGAAGLVLAVSLVAMGSAPANAQTQAPPAAAPPAAAPPAAAPPAADIPAPTVPPTAETPPVPIPGQINLDEAQLQKIRAGVEAANPARQPVPRAFAPAVGMTTPPELELEPLPADLKEIPGLGEGYQYAVLDTGVIMIVGEQRLVAALIGMGNGTTGAR